MNNYKSLKIMLALSITTNAYAQLNKDFFRGMKRRLPPMSIEREISPATLGTQKKNFNQFSSVNKAIVAALPTYGEVALGNYLKKVYYQSLKERPSLKINNYEQMQRTFGLPLKRVSPKVNYVESDQRSKNGPVFAYGMSQSTGEAFLQKNTDHIKSVSIKQGQKIIPLISRAHDSIIKRLGISKDDFLFKETSIMAIGSQSKNGEKGSVLADSFLTYGLRKYKNLMVEESFIKLYSKNTKNFEGMDISWPELQFHPEMKGFKLKNKKELMNEVLGKITKTQRAKSLVNVRMAVVLRPVKMIRNGRLVFIPAIKVGVYSKSGEAGNLFYVDLSKTKFRYIHEDMVEESLQNS